MSILSSTKETCRYEHATGTFFLGGQVDRLKSISQAIVLYYGESADDKVCEVTVRYLDQNHSTKWETMLATYSPVTPNTLVRLQTIASSSSSNLLIEFDETGGDNLVIYGTSSHNAFGVRTLQEDVVSLTDTASTADSDTFINGTTDGATITPSLSSSSLIVTYSSNLAVRRNGSSGTAVSGSYSAGYFNGSDTLVVVGDELEIALRGASPTTDLEVETPVTKTVKLSQSNLDSSGDWKVSPMFNVANGNFRGDCINTTIHYREVL